MQKKFALFKQSGTHPSIAVDTLKIEDTVWEHLVAEIIGLDMSWFYSWKN